MMIKYDSPPPRRSAGILSMSMYMSDGCVWPQPGGGSKKKKGPVAGRPATRRPAARWPGGPAARRLGGHACPTHPSDTPIRHIYIHRGLHSRESPRAVTYETSVPSGPLGNRHTYAIRSTNCDHMFVVRLAVKSLLCL